MRKKKTSQAAAILGAKGGKAKTAAQSAARAANGKRGGRPSARCLSAEQRIKDAREALEAGAVKAALEILDLSRPWPPRG